MIIKPGKNPASGCVLISQPSLTDRFFNRSVVVLAEHGSDGTFGFIVNKPSKIKLSDATDAFEPLDSEVYLGGPVHNDSLFYVHNKGELVEGSLKIVDGVYWGGDMEVLKKLMTEGKMKFGDIRFYLGYSGWEAGQLDREMKENSWIVLDTKPEYVFGNRPVELWKKIVLSLGEDFAPWVNYPADPIMN